MTPESFGPELAVCDEFCGLLFAYFPCSCQKVERSVWDAPTTDLTKRKVCQYVSANLSVPSFSSDYASGHGSHVAGLVAGHIADNDTAATVTVAVVDMFSDCGEFADLCATKFCPTCDLSGSCDATCGFTPSDQPAATEDFSGMAQGAKLLVWDFGDADGNLAVR